MSTKKAVYVQLNRETQAYVHQQANAIRLKLVAIRLNRVEIGECLLQVKAHLPHGAWGPWLRVEIGWSNQTALNYMS